MYNILPSYSTSFLFYYTKNKLFIRLILIGWAWIKAGSECKDMAILKIIVSQQ